MKTILLASLLLAPVPALAQATAPARAAPAAPAVDPARLAAARPVAARVWPLGTYRRLMAGTMDRMMDAVLGTMFGMKAGDVIGAAAGKRSGEAGKALGDATLGEIAGGSDPHFAERMKITTRVLFDEMGGIMAKVEPEVQGAVAHGLARRFTVAELAELDRLFATPLGMRYAADSMLLAIEPEMVGAMVKSIPEFIAVMPGIMGKVAAATAHLPPPPRRKPPEAEEPASPEAGAPLPEDPRP